MTIAQFPPQLQRPPIGTLIRMERERHRDKQAYCAARTRISLRQWKRYEANDSSPSLDSILEIIALYPDLQVTLMSPHVTR